MNLRRGLAMAAIVAGCFGAGIFFGTDAPHALLLGAAVVAGYQIWRLSGSEDEDDEGWPDRRDLDASEGARREVARLSWSMRGLESRVTRQAVDRLRGVARHRLALRGVDLDDPAAADRGAALVGAPTYGWLATPLPALPTIDTFVRAIGAVEQLADEETP